MANLLGSESSPYLKQHQNNPVHWRPWSQEALEYAEREQKLLIVSIGYSTCHWCHVMERESFESKEIAAVMNEHFVCIKVDREERPDLDQVYMTAVQLMTNRGGWPLNCICLPDGRPIYGGTYFRPNEWVHLLNQLQQMWQDQPNLATEYASKLANGIAQSDRLPIKEWKGSFHTEQLEKIVAPWTKDFDPIDGGLQKAPKFPMPSNWEFLLAYGVLHKQPEITDHVHFTLKKLGSGGIYDHVGGGFARYSVDHRWHVPHFEKMLYDNAQLVSLYLAAWQQRPDPQYLRIVQETLDWVLREMRSPNGGFYSALDADSEGVEGKFYTFQKEEFQQLTEYGLTEAEIELLLNHYQITEAGNWEEEETNILYHDFEANEWAYESGYSIDEWDAFLKKAKKSLLDYRAQRVRPGLDTKQLTTWNALQLKAFLDAYRILKNEDYLVVARANAKFIQNYLYAESGTLLHQPKDANREIPAFLDDYAFTITAFISLYEATFEERWLSEAKRLAEIAIKQFYDEGTGVFYYTSKDFPALITRKTELIDNVIPSSNSALFRALQKLSILYERPDWEVMVDQALGRMLDQMQKFGSAHANWALLLLEKVYGSQEWIFSGPNALRFRQRVDLNYQPFKLVLGGTESSIPLLHGRLSEKDAIYLCKDRTCGLPIHSLRELDELLENIH